MTISNREIKKLYSLSAGRCNICKINLFENEVHIGEMAHVIARNQNGPRGYGASVSNRDSYGNLILLCANHHTEVDQNPGKYTIDVLLRIKNEHEQFIRNNLEINPGKTLDVNALQILMDFAPFTKLLSHIYTLPVSIDIDYFIFGDTFENFKIDCPHMYPFENDELTKIFDEFLNNYFTLGSLINGRGKFNNREILHFYETANNRVYMNKYYLPDEYLSKLVKTIEEYCSKLNNSYQRLLNYLRQNYSEVNLVSYNHY